MRLSKYFIALFVLPVFSCGEEKKTVEVKPEKKDTVVKIKPLVQPPFSTAAVPFQEVLFDAAEGKVFTADNGYGTSVNIPGGIFVDSLGNKIEGEIKLKYRELHTLNDMFVSGIPLSYDAAGMLKRFHSGGMVELRAYSQNKTVYLDSGKVIGVNMASFVGGDRHHAFYLDEEKTRNWIYLKDLEGNENPEKKKIIRKARQKVKDFNIPFNGEYFAFNYMALLDVYLNDRTVEIKKNRQDLTIQGKIKEYGVTWTNIYCYQSVEFMGNKYLASLLIWQKLNKEPWPIWMNSANCNIIDEKNGTFTVELSQTKGKGVYKASIKPFFPVKSLLAFSPSYWKNKYNLAVRKAIEEEMRKQKIADVFRTLEVHRFGVYNVDKLQREEDYVQVKVQPQFDEDITIKGDLEIYYLSEMYRTVVKYPVNEWNNITLLPDTDARIFAVLPGNKIALVEKGVLEKMDFNALQKKPGSLVYLRFKTLDAVINTPEDVAKALGISAVPV